MGTSRSERRHEPREQDAPAALSHAEILGEPTSSQLELLEGLSTSRTTQAQRGMFGTPAWYTELCETVSRALWRGQITETEARDRIDLSHRLVQAEMGRRKLWKRPRKSTGRRYRRVEFRYRGVRCPDCGEKVGPFTGLCGPCHFGGWWWPRSGDAEEWPPAA